MRFFFQPIFIYSILLLPSISFSQELSYTHYDTKDGLAGSVVYCMTLDKDGFIWMGTENGVSRFDGTHFKNFTTLDGLPDNEILELFTDSKGRVWMAPFRNSLCYYFKGKMHTQSNDSLLARINPLSNITHFAEDSKGNILMSDFARSRLYLISNKNEVLFIDSVNNQKRLNTFFVTTNKKGNFWVLNDRMLYEYILSSKSFIPVIEMARSALYYRTTFLSANIFVTRTSSDKLMLKNIEHQDSTILPPFLDYLKYSLINDSLFGIGSLAGMKIYNTATLTFASYLKGLPVTYCLMEPEGSFWFSTLGRGVYRLNSNVVKNINFFDKNTFKQTISCIIKKEGKIILGTQASSIYELNVNNNKINISRERYIDKAPQSADIIDVRRLDNGDGVYFTSSRILKMSDKFAYKNLFSAPIKSVIDINKSSVFIGTSHNALIFDPYSFKVKDTIWPQRTTSVFYRNDTFFIGTLNGLYLVKKDKSITYSGTLNQLLKSRIADIKEAKDKTIWIATYGNGILAYKDNKIVTHLTTSNGLTSNICRNIFIKDSDIWVGTDKGLNKIDCFQKSYHVSQYTMADGLASNTVTAIFVDSNYVFVGTREGLSFFDATKLSLNSRCDLRITGISIAGNQYPTDTTNFSVPHKKNNIQFEFVGISYRSAGDITYEYKLTGLDSSWKTTKETYLNYPTLPSGNYEFRIQAINKFGVKSKVISIPFTIEKLFWEKTWFKIVLTLFINAFIWLLLTLRVRFVRGQEKAKQAINHRIKELEQLALKAQMNPHFIFNSLNSIQQYVIDKNIEGANKFISDFSHLMRQTMYFSSKQLISLSDEINYLATYLELENDRLEDIFSHNIIIDRDIAPEDYLVPPMILQPYVENAVRHGMRYKESKTGIVLINISKVGKYLVCIVEDNGIGRKASQQQKGKTSIEYQSKGMSLTSDRIKLLNEKNGSQINVQIDDLETPSGNALGTRVTVCFPVIEN